MQKRARAVVIFKLGMGIMGHKASTAGILNVLVWSKQLTKAANKTSEAYQHQTSYLCTLKCQS